MAGGTADVIIVGAGAAGLMCAITAAGRGCNVTVLEHQKRPGRKVLISGGGRCNFTNLDVHAGAYLSANPHFAKSALARYTPYDFIDLMADHGLGYSEKTLGQLFCNEKSEGILRMLENACERAGVVLQTGVKVRSVVQYRNGFTVGTDKGDVSAGSVVIATGGLSFPKLGATSFGLKVAEQFGLAVIPPRPGLVPLIWNAADQEKWADLAGLATPVTVTCGDAVFKEALLFTHRGLSGPAVLQASSYWSEGRQIEINLLPELDVAAWLIATKRKRPKAELRTVLAQHLPKRLAERLCRVLIQNGRLGTMADATLERVAATLTRWTVTPAATDGYRSAEVTVGGVDTACLSSKTMGAKSVPGLYFIGEVVDVTGWLGGYNFQWAWASGHAAGEAVSPRK